MYWRNFPVRCRPWKAGGKWIQYRWFASFILGILTPLFREKRGLLPRRCTLNSIAVTTTLAKTPLYDWHVAHGGRMVDFAGWSMPVQYSSIVTEHNATRTAVGIFDISHMGRLQFFSKAPADFLDGILTRRVADLNPNQVRYSLVCNQDGGILDDVLVYGGTPDGSRPVSMVVNASNRAKIVEWLGNQLPAWLQKNKGAFMSIGDDTLRSAMIAVQGPKALEVLAPFFKMHPETSRFDLAETQYYHCNSGCFDNFGVLVSRTGYTGEDGFEIICDNEVAMEIWERITDASQKLGGLAVGLGARDTLRLEAAMPLYGHELNEEITPIEAGLGFAVNLEGRSFTGCEKLKAIKQQGPKRVRIGLELAGKRVPREHYEILADGQTIGEVTSGTFSPTLQKPIAMGYVPPQYAEPGTELEIDIRGSREPARVVKLPFYRRAT